MARALESVHGVRSVKASYPEKMAFVVVDKDAVNPAELCAALLKGGFVGNLMA